MSTSSPLGGARADERAGIVQVKSGYPVAETAARIRKVLAERGTGFFVEIDQSRLAAQVGIKLRPSTLLVFGDAALGTQFIAGNPLAGLDWPVRLLVTQDDDGTVWVAWTDFDWIAQRHRISNPALEFKMEKDVIDLIRSGLRAR
jgi:uncharacterized protein (DUF302 family)